MLYSAPKYTYRGLSIVLSNGSRFDKIELLSAMAGYKFNNECLQPELNRYQCEIRIANDPRPFLPDTKCCLLLGQRSLSLHTNSPLTLNEVRGTPLFTKQGIPAIASFFPQDAMDIKNYEAEFNLEYSIEEDEENFIVEDIKGKRGRTQRNNYFFWLKQDTKKAIQIVLNDGKFPKDEIEPEYIIYPNIQEMIKLLETTKNKNIFIDIESDSNFNIRCLGIAIDENNKIT